MGALQKPYQLALVGFLISAFAWKHSFRNGRN
jgi:hypothetical protein